MPSQGTHSAESALANQQATAAAFEESQASEQRSQHNEESDCDSSHQGP